MKDTDGRELFPKEDFKTIGIIIRKLYVFGSVYFISIWLLLALGGWLISLLPPWLATLSKAGMAPLILGILAHILAIIITVKTGCMKDSE